MRLEADSSAKILVGSKSYFSQELNDAITRSTIAAAELGTGFALPVHLLVGLAGYLEEQESYSGPRVYDAVKAAATIMYVGAGRLDPDKVHVSEKFSGPLLNRAFDLGEQRGHKQRTLGDLVDALFENEEVQAALSMLRADLVKEWKSHLASSI